MDKTEKRDRLKTSDFEKRFKLHKSITQTRHNEMMRVADLIEQALYEAESDETQEALVQLAIKVLHP